jgi:uncharacterized protein (DUF433 family)
MKLPDFLREVEYGEILLTGSRIGLYHVISDYKDGMSAEQLHEEFPTLSLELINRVLAFYGENRAEVDAYVAEEQAAIDRLRATTPRHIDWDALRRKFDEQQKAGNT